MGQFTKKPVTIEAFRWTGGPDQAEDPVWACQAVGDGRLTFGDGAIFVRTTEGVMRGEAGDWIIRGVEGELYPCKDSVFQATYAPASRQPDSTGEPAITRAEADAGLASSPAPRVTEEGMRANIETAEYFRARTLTICILTLRNGFTLIGKAACASPENYDQAKGERYAYDDAFRQMWAFEGYLLRERLSQREAEARGQDDAVQAA